MKTQKIWLLPILIIIALLSIFGLLQSSFYDNRLSTITRFELYGQDTITLFITIVSILIIIVVKDSLWKKIILTGGLLYNAYVYGYYIFSLIQNKLFIVDMLVFSLCLYLFMMMLFELMKEGIIINNKYPRITLSIYFFIIIAIMYVIEIPYIINKTIIINEPLRIYDIYCLFDTTLLFPAIIIWGINNLVKKKGAEIIVGIFLIKVLTIMPAIIMNDVFHYLYTRKFIDISFDIIACIITLVTVFMLVLYKRGINITTAST